MDLGPRYVYGKNRWKDGERSGFSIEGSYAIIPSEAIKVGHRHQLLMDDYIVEDHWYCRRTVHQPVKHPKNPLITPKAPSEQHGTPYLCCFYDERIKRFRLYSSCGGVRKGELAKCLMYYESEDGLEWEAPKLGLVEYDGSGENNLFKGGGDYIYDNLDVIELPEGKRDWGRYLLMYNRGVWDGEKRKNLPGLGMQIRLAYSDDGIHFKDQEENPIFTGRSDCQNNLVYNPERDVFMYYRRATINAQEIRRIAYTESSDLVHWTQPRSIVIPDELDPTMLYSMTVDRYRGVYFGFLNMFYFDERKRPDKDHMLDCQLLWSRDGIHWVRHPERPLFLECGSMKDSDWGMIRCGKPIIDRDGRLYLYYAGCNEFHRAMPHSVWSANLATLRADGFVSIDSPDVGFLLTRPIECPGGKLHINAAAGKGGYVCVTARRGDGEFDGLFIPEFEHETPKEGFSGDSTDYTFSFNGRETWDELKGRSVRLHFWMRNAELYSFWFD